ncbi:MAG TPA: hypothetical protein VLO11_06280 [Luteolibacter sp.]|nr:hypothetical protein [Luteolibacter sp.]
MNFKKILTAFLASVTALALSACFQHETTITLNKDGSGTLVEETRLSGQMLAMMGQFAGELGGEGAAAPDPVEQMLSEEKAKERAAQLGEGVTFEKIEPVTVGDAKGARVTYRFADINKLRVSTEDSMSQMATPQGLPDAAKPDAADKKPITFIYKDGVLTIRPDHDKDADKPGAEDKAEAAEELNDPQAMEMMKQMFTDMKISYKLVAASGIAETNATHRDGDTITLMEMDMNKLMEKPENFKKLAAVDQDNPAAAMEALKGIDGVKAEVKPEITVKLK